VREGAVRMAAAELSLLGILLVLADRKELKIAVVRTCLLYGFFMAYISWAFG
jgi:hypothetical protein